jgi:hypothetical protein
MNLCYAKYREVFTQNLQYWYSHRHENFYRLSKAIPVEMRERRLLNFPGSSYRNEINVMLFCSTPPPPSPFPIPTPSPAPSSTPSHFPSTFPCTCTFPTPSPSSSPRRRLWPTSVLITEEVIDAATMAAESDAKIVLDATTMAAESDANAKIVFDTATMAAESDANAKIVFDTATMAAESDAKIVIDVLLALFDHGVEPSQ